MARMPRTSQIWAAYTGGSLRLPSDVGGMLGNVSKMLGMIQSATVYLDLSTGLNGMIEGTAKSDQDGENIASGLRAFIGLARLSVPANQPELQQVWDGLRPTREGTDVKLHIDEPEDMVGRIAALLGSKPASNR